MNMQIKLFSNILLFIVLSFNSCEKMDNTVFFLPENKILKISTINEIEMTYKVSFSQYEGFYISIESENKILDTLLLITSDYFYSFNSLLSDEEIINCKKQQVIELRSTKIPKNKYSYNDILTYLKKMYPKISNVNSNEILEKCEFFNYNHEKIIGVEYVELGMSGYFITIFPVSNK